LPTAAVPPEATDERAAIHPGDVVQVTEQGHALYGSFGLVRELHGWGLGVDFLAVTETAGRVGITYQRLKRSELAAIGAALIMPPDILSARRDSIETARLIEQEKQ
jgi:hypothetical protein